MIKFWVALLVVSAVTYTVIGPAATAKDGQTPLTGPLNVTATLLVSSYRSVPPSGRRADVEEQAWRITDRNGTRIGRMLLSCRWVQRRARLCVGELRKTGGSLQLQGSSATGLNVLYAITGGTGIFQSAGGAMKFTAIGNRKAVMFGVITT